MRAVVQRVTQARVSVEGATVGRIGPGLLVLVGVAPSDTSADARALAAKIFALRVFADDQDRMNRSIADSKGEILVVSQFTLYADVLRGHRPSFSGAADPAHAEPLVEEVISALESLGAPVASGRFGARMQVEITNEGPVTLLIETSNGKVS